MILRDLISTINDDQINVELVKETKCGNSFTEWFNSNNGALVLFWGGYKVTYFEEIPSTYDGKKGHIKIKIQLEEKEGTMTTKEAQEIVKKHGLGWTVAEVIETERLYGIICKWNGNVRHMIYSKTEGKVIKIGEGFPW